ncbi:MAG TPA: hypothetical protein PLQ71_12440 [Nitrospira sp.]|nr:hypothetical protein [Nitrospira sp.]
MEVMIIEDRGDFNEISIVEVEGPERPYEAVQAQVANAYKTYRAAEAARVVAERAYRERAYHYWNDGREDIIVLAIFYCEDDDGDYGRHMKSATIAVAKAEAAEREAKALYDELYKEFAELIPPPSDGDFNLDSFDDLL